MRESAKLAAAQIVERAANIGEHGLVAADVLEELEHLLELPVFDDRSGAGAVEQIGGDRVVSGGRAPTGDVFDVRIDAEGLLHHDDCAAWGILGNGLVAAHRAVGGRDGDVAGLHVGEATRISTRLNCVKPMAVARDLLCRGVGSQFESGGTATRRCRSS